MSEPIYEIYQDVHGKYKFRLRATNSEIVAVGEGYKTKSECINGINAVKEHHNAAIKDLTIGETTLVLDIPPSKLKKGSSIAFTGKLYGNDLGQGVVKAKINIFESDGALLKRTHLASGTTDLNGNFNIKWISKKMDWWDNSIEIFANFEGTSTLKSSISEKRSIFLC